MLTANCCEDFKTYSIKRCGIDEKDGRQYEAVVTSPLLLSRQLQMHAEDMSPACPHNLNGLVEHILNYLTLEP